MKILQNVMKAAKIICIILIVMYVILAGTGLFGFIAGCFDASSVQIGGTLIAEFMDYGDGLTKTESQVVLAGFVAVAVGELFLLFQLKRYLNHELAARTPFTKQSADELLRLGVKALSVFAAVMAVCCITRLIVFGNTELDAIETESFFLGRHGVELLLLSVVFRAGAEDKQKL